MNILAAAMFDTGWARDHVAEIGQRTLEHIQLTGIALLFGLVISFPVAIYAYRHRRVYAPVTWFAGLLYTIPSLALFALLVPLTGLSTLTAEIGLVSYTLLILIRNIVAGLDAVPEDAREAARGMGLTSRQLLVRVELPLAVPVIVAGIRIAAVTTMGLVTVTALIGKGGLGYFILLGLNRFFSTPIFLGAGLSVVLALVADALLLWLQGRLAPWSRVRSASG